MLPRAQRKEERGEKGRGGRHVSCPHAGGAVWRRGGVREGDVPPMSTAVFDASDKFNAKSMGAHRGVRRARG